MIRIYGLKKQQWYLRKINMLDLLIITGASRGIGNSIANKCSTICKNMIVISSSNKIDNVKFDSCKTLSLQLDLTDYNKTYCILKDVIKSINEIETIKSLGIVLCAAQLGEPGGLFSSPLESWDDTYKCNVLGNLAVIKGCQKIIESGIQTRIVFFSGGGGAYANEKFSGYALTKCAVIREVENLSIELSAINKDLSIIALSPGACKTNMLKTVESYGGYVKTYTKIEEPTDFCYKFLTDQFSSKLLNGMFLHVRDDINIIDEAIKNNSNIYKLRRVE